MNNNNNMDDKMNLMDDLNSDYFESSLLSCWNDPPESDGGDASGHDRPSKRGDDDDDDEEENAIKASSSENVFMRLPSFSMVDENTGSSHMPEQQQQPRTTGTTTTTGSQHQHHSNNNTDNRAYLSEDATSELNDAFWQIPSHQTTSTTTTTTVLPQGNNNNMTTATMSADQLAAALLPFSQQLAMAYGAAAAAASNNNVANAISDTESNTQASRQPHFHHHHHQQHQHGNNNHTHDSSSNMPTLDRDLQHLHPLGIQSSASCPPNVVLGTAGLNLSALFPFAAAAFGTVDPMAFSGATVGASPFLFPNNVPQQQQVPQQLMQQQQQPPIQQQQQQQQPQVQLQQPLVTAIGAGQSSNSAFALVQPSAAAPLPAVAAISKSSSRGTKKSQSPTLKGQSKSKSTRRSASSKAKNSNNNGSNNNNNNNSPDEMPPFYLFDAPVELRNNFMQSQRMHGLPVSQDSNSFHYGISVNGFHPQVNAQDNPVVLPPVHLVDARHCKQRSECSVKNEREQRRTQKIAELIDELRVNMEKGGWKGEMRSKFHILSTCADYMKHLIKRNTDREEAVKQARSDLDMKERALEEDKNVQDRSDPESVTSSLTTSSRGSGDFSNTTTSNNNNNHSEGDDSHKKRKAPGGNTSEQEQDSNNDSANKKARLDLEHDPVAISSGDSGNGSRDTGEKVTISLDKTTTSSVSDVTDSNRGCSNSGSEEEQGGCAAMNYSISSDAAVAAGEGSNGREIDPLDVVIRKRNHKKQNPEAMSVESNFELDYEEVFNQSNIPQLLSTSAGRIIAWNKFFLKATGLKPEEIECMTIFSLVKPDKLSNLFEIVATALRGEGEQNNDATMTNGETSGQTDGEPTSSADDATPPSRQWNYAAMTLPCVTFPATKLRRQTASESKSSELFMTVTLMADEDPRKRCFHCVFTDCPGTNGTLGFITPELLALLFNEHKTANKPFEIKIGQGKSSHHHHRHHHHGGKNKSQSEDAEVTIIHESSESSS